MINARLVWFLESNGLLSNIQCGFRQGRNTLDHLVRFETFIRNAFVKKEHVVSIFFDLEKAYNTTWKYGILKDPLWGWKVSYLISFQIFYLTENLLSELIQPILTFRNKRWEFPREAPLCYIIQY